MPQMYHLYSAIVKLCLYIFCCVLLVQNETLAQGLSNDFPSPPEAQLESARLLYNNLKLEEALRAYNTMLVEYQDNGEVLFGLALTTEALQDYDQALIYYNLLVHYDFELPEIYMNRGKIRYAKMQFEAARNDFEIGEQVPVRETRLVQFKGWTPSEGSATQMEEISTSNSWANEFTEWQAKCLLKLNRLEDALLKYQELIERAPKSVLYLLGRSEVYIVNGDMTAAINDLKNALMIDPSNEQATFNLLQLSNEDVSEEDLLNLYDEILATSPDITEVFMNKGIILYKRGDYSDALENANKAIELNNEKGIYFFNRSLIYTKMERFAEANKDLREAVSLHPDYAPAWAALGNNHIEMERYSEAIEDFQLALFYDANNPIYHFNRAVAFHKSGKLPEACNDFGIAANMGLKEAQEMTLKLCGIKK